MEARVTLFNLLFIADWTDNEKKRLWISVGMDLFYLAMAMNLFLTIYEGREH